MRTTRLFVDPLRPQAEVIAQAAAVLKSGGIVAFPTETVYGLGADALDPAAVARIFAAKGRPSNNPLIVHTTSVETARTLCAVWPAAAKRLAAAFWPGPLTIVLPKAACVPAIVTAGGPTVALRIPGHPTARALIDAAGVPLAAPSANLSTRVSGVRAEHVLRMLDGRIDMVLDGGPVPGGLESTVVDVSGDVVRILRPGPITVEQLERTLDLPIVAKQVSAEIDEPSLPSPGLLKKHYSPSMPVTLTSDDGRRLAGALAASGMKVGRISISEADDPDVKSSAVVCIAMPREPDAYAACLYDALHSLEQANVDHIVIERPPRGPQWDAVNDRLVRAAALDD